jgi:hypothetical protein
MNRRRGESQNCRQDARTAHFQHDAKNKSSALAGCVARIHVESLLAKQSDEGGGGPREGAVAPVDQAEFSGEVDV